jgi:hypothetical protein
MRIKLFILGLLISVSLLSQDKSDQEIIKIKNPSFEGKPQQSNLPPKWNNVGSIYFVGESGPDTQPGFWEVKSKPSEGDTYVSLVVRDVETFEALGQKLKSPLVEGKSYSFSLDLCQSRKYKSMSQITGDMSNYTGPVLVRIIGGGDGWEDRNLLASSPVIEHQDWKRYKFNFEVPKEINYFIIEVNHTDPKNPYNGHVLIDNASDIIVETN